MIRDYVKQLRVYQWTKSGFIFLPAVFSEYMPRMAVDPFGVLSLSIALKLTCAFLAYSFLASAVYVINDFKDRELDRLDARKKHRPIASGRIGTTGALVAIAILVTMSAALSLALPWAFSAVLAVYFGQNIFYTYLGKRILLVDVFMIALGFVLRVIAGAAAIDIAPSPWLLSCTLFLSLFLGFFKRHYELQTAPPEKFIGGQYTEQVLRSFIGITASLSVMNYAIYTLEGKHAEDHLYWTIPLVVLGIFRYYTLMDEPQLEDGNPSDVLLSDPFLIAVIVVWVGLSAALILT
jgi:decaprenyl-phosphate phosphoribosyltransferase